MSTTIALRPPGHAVHGGLAARRAVVRWAWRMFRREWRQHLLVVALLTLAVAAAVGGSAMAFEGAPPAAAELGDARFRFDLSPPAGGEAALVARAEQALGQDVEVIGRQSAGVAGSTERVELRAQDPEASLGRPLLRLVGGRYPTAPGELALTNGAAALIGIDPSDTPATIELGRVERTVVGTVENPTDLDDEFALVAPLSSQSSQSQADRDGGTSLTLLIGPGASDQQVAAFQATLGGAVAARTPESEATTAAVLALTLASVVLLLVSLIAAAGFVAVAQRRQRQMGMLAALGATDRHLRLVMVADGAAVGLVAAVAGAGLGLAGWFASAHRLEAAVEHRINPADVRPWIVAAGMVLAVATAIAAAWWPARTMARASITGALAAQRPRPRPVIRTALGSVGLVAAGMVLVAIGIEDGGAKVRPLAMVPGALIIAVGILLACPTAIRLLATAAGRAPLAIRLALRDLGRHQARSAATLAAVSLALGIPVATVLIASGTDYTSRRDAGAGNLADDQLLFRLGDEPEIVPDRTVDEITGLDTAVDDLAATLGDATVVPIDAVIDPAVEGGGPGGPGSSGGDLSPSRPSDLLLSPLGGERYRGHVVDLATPELLALAGVDPADVDPDADVLTSVTGDLIWLTGPGESLKGDRSDSRDEPVAAQHIDGPGYTSLPSSLMTSDAIADRGWTTARSAWLVDAPHALTDQQLAQARDAAADAGLFVEAREAPRSTATLRTVATGLGLFVALAILTMTVGLLRSEAADDQRTLIAVGASSRTRRAITAATAAALALAGTVLGTTGAYAAIVAAYLDDPAPLGHVPLGHLAAIVVGLPLVAAAGGYLLAGSSRGRDLA